MTVAAIEGPDLLIVLGIVLLLFGSTKLPQLARSLGQAKNEFHKGIHGDDTTAAKPSDVATPDGEPKNDRGQLGQASPQ